MANENFNDGVYLNPDTGNIIATGVLSANGTSVPSPETAFFGSRNLIEVISAYSMSADLDQYYQKNETSSAVEISAALQDIDIDDKLLNLKYTLKTAELIPYGNGLCCQLSNYTITTVRLSSSIPLSVFLPSVTDDQSVRDFVIRFENTTIGNATIAFVPNGLEDIDYESNDESWMDVEPGVNIISFTETKR